MSNKPYYKDVELSLSSLNALPVQPTYVSPLLLHATTYGLDAHIPSSLDDDAPPSLLPSLTPQTSSFIYVPPNSHTESEEIRRFVASNSINPTPSIE